MVSKKIKKFSKDNFGTLPRLGSFISVKEFKKFLKTSIKSDDIYYGCESNTCPLVAATGYAVSGELYAVHPQLLETGIANIYDPDDVALCNHLPDWAQRFTSKFDSRSEDLEPYGVIPNAKMALVCLEEVLREMKSGN